MQIRVRIAEKAGTLTASERRIANTILADYPFSALVSIKQLADHTRVSAPSITRFVHKLGCAGYLEFQRALIGELREETRSPIDLKQRETALSSTGFLVDYAARVVRNLQELSGAALPSDLDAICTLLGDPARAIYLVGGRVSGALAEYLAVHLRQLRPNVTLLTANSAALPDDILRIRRQDVVLILDFRRYQTDLERLAATIAGSRRVQSRADHRQVDFAGRPPLQPRSSRADRDRNAVGQLHGGVCRDRGSDRPDQRERLGQVGRADARMGRPA